MKQINDFMAEMADFDIYPETILWRAGSPLEITEKGGDIILEIPFSPYRLRGNLQAANDLEKEIKTFSLQAFGDEILRLTTSTKRLTDSPMLEFDDSIKRTPLKIRIVEKGWSILDSSGHQRAMFYSYQEPTLGWSELISPSTDSLRGSIFTDHRTQVSFSTWDQFFPEKVESLPLGFIEQGPVASDFHIESADTCTSKCREVLFSFHAEHNEHFAGTGERFAPLNLRGKTLLLENTDAMGVNSPRAYKNVPFYLSSRGYGLFIHTSAHTRLSIADISTRAVQGRIEEPDWDFFFIGGGNPERILYNYRCLTGFPPMLPLWSYGIWMSRMTYFSANEIEEITDRLRKEKYPCDLIHIDTGWFEKDWVCEWKFSNERFPSPEAFMASLKTKGFRVSLWQTPNIGEGNCLLEKAKAKRYLAPTKITGVSSSSDFSGQDFGGQIDFTNPEAVSWYQSMIRILLEKGAAVIKTDFGEKIHMDSDYMNMSAEQLHNIYGLLYQKAAFEETKRTTGEGIIWARAGWAGCQRYPLHWGGDAAATWDGMAGSLRGGLHLGLSGYGYWSHDVPGFHSLPEFMNTQVSDELYIRWTQFSVFSSHIRYHGTSPREPWHFPAITVLIRRWFNLRYALIPYFLKIADKISQTGYPFLRAMPFHFPDDPVCWEIDDQFFCGDSFLVCPVMNEQGVRNVYLPEGQWVNFWTGEFLEGPCHLKDVVSPLEYLPLYCPVGVDIPVYPEVVQCTDEMDLSQTIVITIDRNYPGFLNLPQRAAWGW